MSAEPCLVVFDVDGTLVDTQLSIIEGFVAGFEAAGLVPPTATAIRRGVGLSMEIAVAHLLPEADAGLVERVAHLSREAVWSLRQRPDYAEPLYPGALAAIEQIEMPGMLEMVVNVRSGYKNLVRRGMSVMMADDEQIKVQRKVDRMRACLRLFGESVYPDNFD